MYDDFKANGIARVFRRDESLSGSDITSKLEPAFLSGMRCTQPLIRAKFFEVFDTSMKRRVYERLLYICCSQNWEAMGSHFWIKQCTEVSQPPWDTHGYREAVGCRWIIVPLTSSMKVMMLKY